MPENLVSWGPTIEVVVVHHETGQDDHQETVLALIDTGASATFIDSALAEKLGLPLVGRQRCCGSDGYHGSDVYTAKILIPTLGIEMCGDFVAAKMSQGGQRHRVLLGRPFLKNLVMTYNGFTGQVSIRKP